MTIIRRPQGNNTAGGPHVEGNKRVPGKQIKSPVRNVGKGGPKAKKGRSY